MRRNLRSRQNAVYRKRRDLKWHQAKFMGSANPVLDKIPDKKRGMGVILCMIDKKTYLRENLIVIPMEYL